jgi:hypothetical protein
MKRASLYLVSQPLTPEFSSSNPVCRCIYFIFPSCFNTFPLNECFMCNQISHLKIQRSAHTMYLCVSYGSQDKQQLEDECLLLGCYTASTGNSLPKSQDNLSVPSSRVNTQRLFHYTALTNCFIA